MLVRKTVGKVPKKTCRALPCTQKSSDWDRPNLRKPYISLQTEDSKENIIQTLPKHMQTGIDQLNATHYLQGLPMCSATFQSACAGKLHA